MRFKVVTDFCELFITDEKWREYGSLDWLQKWACMNVWYDFQCDEPLLPWNFLFLSWAPHYELWYSEFMKILESSYNKYEEEESDEKITPSFISSCVPNNLKEDTSTVKETKVQENSIEWEWETKNHNHIKIDINIYSKLRLYKTTELIKELWMNHGSIKKWLHTIPYDNKHILKEDILNLFIKQLDHE